MNDNEKRPTPAQFYRTRRPEFFSDSKIETQVELPKEQLAFEISQISTNQKHDSFETLCRKLAEKLVSPNLIPQVGPTGGGDGKTDSETYPVSSFISDRWFVSKNEWNENENWAFAISAKQDWKPKIKSDVKKIIGTKRGYTRIFFFSNQKISSKNKKELQDDIKLQYDIDLVIFDAEWIIEKVYSNRLINDVIESLNLSRTYLETKVIGPRDRERLKQLEELEKRINSPNRFFEIDFQLIEECLESAKISRMLERPKTEVIGRFERSVKLAAKLDNIQLKIRVHYQFAWTLINWYDDYKSFYDEFLIVKDLVTNEPNLNNIECYINLSNILATVSSIEKANNILPTDREQNDHDLIQFLTNCSKNTKKPSTSLLAKFHLAFFQIRKKLENKKTVSDELIQVAEYFEVSKNHLDIPFEQLKDCIAVYDEILPDSKDYDKLIDVIAEIEASRVSELTSGQTYLNRGITKLNNNLTKESLVYFGKASRRLAKDETQTEFYYCLLLLSDAYSKLGLYWASYNALVSATNIFANNWYTTGNLDPRFLKSIEAILKNEAIIGRVPVLLCWYELHSVLKRFTQQEIDDNNLESIPLDQQIDAYLSIRLLNLKYKDFNNLKSLPDILKINELWLSEDAALYLLGHEDLIEIDETKTSIKKSNLSEFYDKFANQPFKMQIAYETNFLNKPRNSIDSQILGTKLKITFPQVSSLLILAENILAYFESFLATSFEEAFPVSESIIINIDFKEIESAFDLKFISKQHINLLIRKGAVFTDRKFNALIDELLPQLIGGNYIFKNMQSFFENLFGKDEVNERLSIILQHNGFLTNVLTDAPKLFLEDWMNSEIKEYKIRSKESPISENRTFTKANKREKNTDFKNISHKKVKSETIINMDLWDKAKWSGFGSFSSQEIPFGIFLNFDNAVFGQQIFKEWIEKYGSNDPENIISITIVKGINKNKPTWYKVLVSKNVNKNLFEHGTLVSMTSRFHRLEPTSDTNLNKLIKNYGIFKRYFLVPSSVDKNLNITPNSNLGILKADLKIIDAWTIGVNDIERNVITADDDPIIPSGVTDAPVLDVLKEKKMLN